MTDLRELAGKADALAGIVLKSTDRLKLTNTILMNIVALQLETLARLDRVIQNGRITHGGGPG